MYKRQLFGPLALVGLAAAIDVSLGGHVALGVPFIGALILPPIGEELGCAAIYNQRSRERTARSWRRSVSALRGRSGTSCPP